MAAAGYEIVVVELKCADEIGLRDATLRSCHGIGLGKALVRWRLWQDWEEKEESGGRGKQNSVCVVRLRPQVCL